MASSISPRTYMDTTTALLTIGVSLTILHPPRGSASLLLYAAAAYAVLPLAALAAALPGAERAVPRAFAGKAHLRAARSAHALPRTPKPRPEPDRQCRHADSGHRREAVHPPGHHGARRVL